MKRPSHVLAASLLLLGFAGCGDGKEGERKIAAGQSGAVAGGKTTGGLPAGNFAVDPVHSTVLFRVKHAGVSHFHGSFADVSGSVTLAPDHAASSLEVRVKAGSVHTHDAARDRHLRGADFFSAGEFPQIVFKSSRVAAPAAGRLEVTGDLTLHGRTRRITIPVEITGSGKDRKGRPIVGGEAVFTIKRSDYGMRYGLTGIGDEVRITIALECVEK